MLCERGTLALRYLGCLPQNFPQPGIPGISNTTTVGVTEDSRFDKNCVIFKLL